MELSKREIEEVKHIILEKQVEIDMQVADLEDRGTPYKDDVRCLTNERDMLEDILAKIRKEQIKEA